MWHALNLEGTVKDLFGDLATVAQAPLAQGVIGAPQLAPYEYDPAKAKQLLAQAACRTASVRRCSGRSKAVRTSARSRRR